VMLFYRHNHDLDKSVQNLTYSYKKSCSTVNGVRIKWGKGE